MPLFELMAVVSELGSRRDSALRYMCLPRALVRCQASGRQVGELGCHRQSRMRSVKSCFPSPRELETPSEAKVCLDIRTMFVVAEMAAELIEQWHQVAVEEVVDEEQCRE
jgi:hypothetical protein